jgi:hypothetical protein
MWHCISNLTFLLDSLSHYNKINLKTKFFVVSRAVVMPFHVAETCKSGRKTRRMETNKQRGVESSKTGQRENNLVIRKYSDTAFL